MKFTSDNTESYDQPFTLTELQNSISKSNNSAPGPDRIDRIETLIREAFIKKEYLVAVLFDLEKAYDTTWPCGLLKDLGLQGRLPIFIKHFLEDWTFQTWINNTLSDPKQQEIGVPQGSILSVILFMIKINKITCLPPEINGSLYVDDFFICYSSISMMTIKRKMQQCINKILKWTMKNGFKIPNNKTKCMHFCQIHKMLNQPTLTLNGSEIPITQQYKFLGITLDPKLSFIPHIKELRIQCNQTIQPWEP